MFGIGKYYYVQFLVLYTDEIQLPPVDFGPPVEKHYENVSVLTNTGLVSASFFIFNTCMYVCMYVCMFVCLLDVRTY